ncbi:MAG: DUF5329 domain-containing protein [Rhodanobacter sp.]|nr:DUF5329 domain-containing protein [Rhodanobacter sp.]
MRPDNFLPIQLSPVIAGDRVRHRKILVAMVMGLLMLALAVPVPARQMTKQPSAEQQKINYLIDSVAALSDATFIRNGTDYDAARAAEHMRLKLRFAGSSVATAEEFIACCGTGSSISGKPYLIRFHDGRVVESATYLRCKLAEYDAAVARTAHKGKLRPSHH